MRVRVAAAMAGDKRGRASSTGDLRGDAGGPKARKVTQEEMAKPVGKLQIEEGVKPMAKREDRNDWAKLQIKVGVKHPAKEWQDRNDRWRRSWRIARTGLS
ncbi:hypothetical protein PR202_ga13825 [Eleusine coracana subsp. coracana]|uniref:Uncharacterized protein n=1 Tax=Eleusine coracana subsp. coracana TaxID=191504 RepID=A0AAV5CF14_ELECO|nr:hypothetical protein PR202_ga13825 [Eleusine coracana subsp. coracana]